MVMKPHDVLALVALLGSMQKGQTLTIGGATFPVSETWDVLNEMIDEGQRFGRPISKLTAAVGFFPSPISYRGVAVAGDARSDDTVTLTMG